MDVGSILSAATPDEIPEGHWNILCEMNVTVAREDACNAELQFRCNDSSCIYRDNVCDGVADCPTREDEISCECNDMSFTCGSTGQCIPLSKVCDFVQDCPDGSDEVLCIRPLCDAGQFRCTDGLCIDASKRCNSVADCKDGKDEFQCRRDECKGFFCYSGKCISRGKQEDMVVDCSAQTLEDEADHHDEDTVKDWGEEGFCSAPGQVPCNRYQRKCAERSKTCIYDYDEEGIGKECRTGKHLENCHNYDCPNMFKCPDSYCLPISKVCNGRWDCIDGDDERPLLCANYTCPGKFRCKSESYCINQEQLCDGVVDCVVSKEDEKYCTIQCPANCTCHGNAVSCPYSNHTIIPKLSKEVRVLVMRRGNLTLSNESFLGYNFMVKLNISSNNICNLPVGGFRDMANLISLDLSDNCVSSLYEGIFNGLLSLSDLRLSNNPVVVVSAHAFFGLSERMQNLHLESLGIRLIEDAAFEKLQIKALHLQNNRIEKVNKYTFQGLKNLSELNLERNSISFLHREAFLDAKWKALRTDEFRFCCFAKDVEACTPTGDAYSSCEDLMANQILQYCIWIMGVLALIGNVVVLIGRFRSARNKAPSFFILNLSISDFLMGVYLLIIAAADQYYRGTYILHAKQWKASHLCRFAGFLSFLSSIMSAYILTTVTIDRVVCVVFAFKVASITTRQARIIMACGWVLCIFFSILPIVNIPYFGADYIKNGVCLLYNSRHGKVQGWEYTFSILMVYNLTACLVFIGGYGWMYRSVVKARKDSGREGNEREIALAKKMVLIIGTNFLCWSPMIVASILSYNGVILPNQVIAWLTVFILPLNTALNPFIYTLSSMQKGKSNSKKITRPKPQSNASITTTTTIKSTS